MAKSQSFHTRVHRPLNASGHRSARKHPFAIPEADQGILGDGKMRGLKIPSGCCAAGSALRGFRKKQKERRKKPLCRAPEKGNRPELSCIPCLSVLFRDSLSFFLHPAFLVAGFVPRPDHVLVKPELPSAPVTNRMHAG